MMKRFTFYFYALALWTVIGICPAMAQEEFFNYKPVQAKGSIPPEFIKLTTEKFEAGKGSITKAGTENKKKTAKAKERFYLQVNYALDELMTSGKVLFGDTMTRYVNRVADVILKNDPKLRQELKFYVVKSEHVNAFATQIGYIFINIGLLAQIENEAQLAYILCHEITHYVKEHSFAKYLETERIKTGKGDYKRLRLHEKLLASHGFSRELEKEADEYGLTLFNATPYAREKLENVFEVLHYGYLPFDEVPFDTNFFETEYLRFPQGYFPKKIDSYSNAEEDKDDTMSTHPAMIKRKEGLEKLIKSTKRTSKAEEKISVLPEGSFDYVQKTARYEMGRLLMMDKNYERAIYNAYLYIKEDGANLYHEKIILKSLYALTLYKNEGSFSSVHASHKRTEGEIQRLLHLTDKLKDDELNATALIYGLELKKKYPDDKEIVYFTNELMRMMVFNHVSDLSDYEKEPQKAKAAVEKAAVEDKAQAADTTYGVSPAEFAKLTKVEKIRLKAKRDAKLRAEKKKKKGGSDEEEKNFLYYGFVEYLKDSSFTKQYRKFTAEKQKIDKAKEDEEAAQKQKRKKRSKEKKTEDKGDKLIALYKRGTVIDKIVILKPTFIKVNEGKKKEKVRISDSEEAQLAYSEKLKEIAKEVKLDLEVIAPKELKPEQTAAFNDMSFISEFFQERFSHDDVDSILTLEPGRAEALVKKYGTPYFGYSVVVNLQEQKQKAALFPILCAIFPPLWFVFPIAMVQAVKPKYTTGFFTFLVDVRTGKSVYVHSHEVNLNAREDVMSQFIYDNLFSIKHLADKK